ncbi:MAG: PAS domain-containing protein, partial [Ferruginibacter sp.]
DYVPGAICQLEMHPNGEITFPFISKGIADLHPTLTPEKLKNNPGMIFKVIHDDDLVSVQESMHASFLNLTAWKTEYRVISGNGKILWLWINANPERKNDGTVVWYGTIEDITEKKEYIKALEGILFDISHVIRKPVTTMLGLINAFQIEDLDEKRLKECLGYIQTVAKEMDEYTKALTEKYFEISLNFSNPKTISKVQLEQLN